MCSLDISFMGNGRKLQSSWPEAKEEQQSEVNVATQEKKRIIQLQDKAKLNG